MLELMKMPSQYPADFEEFWKAYKSPDVKNSGKKAALTAWKKSQKLLPRLEILLACVEAYDNWLAAERSKNKNGFPAKCHAATFLSPHQERWEGFLDDAEAILSRRQGHSQADLSASAKTWNKYALDRLRLALGDNAEAIIHQWFLPTVMDGDYPGTIRCPTEFHRNYLENKYMQVIRKVFGPNFTVTVTGQEKGPAK